MGTSTPTKKNDAAHPLIRHLLQVIKCELSAPDTFFHRHKHTRKQQSLAMAYGGGNTGQIAFSSGKYYINCSRLAVYSEWSLDNQSCVFALLASILSSYTIAVKPGGVSTRSLGYSIRQIQNFHTRVVFNTFPSRTSGSESEVSSVLDLTLDLGSDIMITRLNITANCKFRDCLVNYNTKPIRKLNTLGTWLSFSFSYESELPPMDLAS